MLISNASIQGGRSAQKVVVVLTLILTVPPTLLGSRHSQGFEDKNLDSSPGLLGQKVATVAAHQPGELPKSKSTQPTAKPPAPPCSSQE